MRGSDSAPVAQLDRVSGYEPEGRAFESLRARHSEQTLRPIFGLAFLFFGAESENSPPQFPPQLSMLHLALIQGYESSLDAAV